MITMTIEVSPEQAVEIAKILSTSAPAAPVQIAPVAAPAVPPVQQPIPTSAPAPAAAPVAIPVVSASALTPPPVTAAHPAPTPAPIPAPVTPMVPTAVKKYTMDELSLGSRPIVEAGRQQELLNFLHSFTYVDANGVQRNVQSIRDLPEEMYPAFANGIRQMGGRI